MFRLRIGDRIFDIIKYPRLNEEAGSPQRNLLRITEGQVKTDLEILSRRILEEKWHQRLRNPGK